MPLSTGTRLGAYEIVALLGIGGMGEVYRARDTRLNRFVAMKVLPPGLSVDQRRRERFEREARAISSLNHPRICTLHDVGRHESVDYLVMELLEGQTLAERLLKGRLPLDETLTYAIQIADALECAHRHGIIHRDLKPANIMLTTSGAKVVDFGIAKAADPVDAAAAQSTLTEEGTRLGTVQYMAPEQLEGRAADPRSDLFAFGGVVYEMLTGRRAFTGDSQSKVIAAVLDCEPPTITSTQPMTPPALEHLVTRCLAKNPDERWQNAGDVKRELQWIAAGTRSTAMPPTDIGMGTGTRLWRNVAIVASLMALVVGGALTWTVRTKRLDAPGLPEARLEISTPPSLRPSEFSMSPDGLTVAFVAQSEGHSVLWVRALNDVTARPLAGTSDAWTPFWSPDGQAIGFFADGKLKRIDVKGGAPQNLADAPEPQGGAWGRDGTIVFTPHELSPVLRVSAAGGEPSAATRLAPGHAGHLHPQLLPDGQVLYYVASAPDSRGTYLDRLDGTAPRKLIEGAGPALYWTGHVLFARKNTLFAQALDPVRGEMTGSPVRVADRIINRAFSVSATGAILYRAASTGGGRRLTWFDRSGETVNQVGDPDGARVGSPLSLSPDGHRVAITRQLAGKSDLWLIDLERRGAMSRLTHGGGETRPLWSRDGMHITYNSNRKGHFGTFQREVDSDRDEPLAVTTMIYPADWSPDGRFLLYVFADPNLDADRNTHLDIWALRVGSGEKPFPVVRSPLEDLNPQFAPDGRWIAYESSESGRREAVRSAIPGSRRAGAYFH